MIKKTITYTDYNGDSHTEDFFFNLSQAEVTKMQTSMPGGWSEAVQKIVKKEDIPSIMDIFEDLILRSYGEKSPDGRRFIKSKEMANAFSQTEAYSELYIELLTNADKAAEFFNGVIPNIPNTLKDNKSEEKEKSIISTDEN